MHECEIDNFCLQPCFHLLRRKTIVTSLSNVELTQQHLVTRDIILWSQKIQKAENAEKAGYA